ncbi:MAG: class I SAM-dependent methyltransferase [Anaerolineae bacterium]|nr:class I SAM-dependent methyltransferase [Anaerolineae bacterium]
MMESITNWLSLWRDLVIAYARGRQAEDTGQTDVWLTKAHAYHEAVLQRWAKPDSSRDFIAADLAVHPGDTALDIGAGTGAWTVFLAQRARQVTALDPSPAMLAVLQENVAAAGLDNVAVIQGGWPEIAVQPHDVVLCSHALYGVPDFAAFVHKMEQVARRRCYLLLRIPMPDSIMAEAARHVWGHPYDSPNFQVAYNALMQLGIFTNVLLEDTGLWEPWTNASLDEALVNVKRRLGLVEDTTHDAFLSDLLARRLSKRDGQFVWPRGTRSALVYWNREASQSE